MAILSSWTYDFGELTGAALTAQPAVAINDDIAAAKAAALSMIASGSFGPTNGVYRIIVRASPTNPQSVAVEVKLVP